MSICYYNGEFCQESSVRLPLNDLGITRGCAVFDYLRTYKGLPFHLEGHIDRLEISAKLIAIKELPYSKQEIAHAVHQLLSKTKGEMGVRIYLSAGIPSRSIFPGNAPNLLITLHPFTPFPEEFYRSGIKALPLRLDRQLVASKTCNYLNAVIALQERKDEGFEEVVYQDENGGFLEGATSNFFVVVNEKLYTAPKERVLFGITRKIVMELAEESGVSVVEKIAPIGSVWSEAFISSSNREIMPVVAIGEKVVGSGKPGPVTALLQQKFAAYVSDWCSRQKKAL